MPELKRDLEATAEALREAYRVLIFAGSGLSAESGVPTFRGTGGMLNEPEIAARITAHAFEQDTETQLAWYQEMRQEMIAIAPNAGHMAIARMVARGRRLWTMATQNVDHLQQRACAALGVEMEIAQLHGSLMRVSCHDCKAYGFLDRGYDLRSQTPCPRCGGRLRPDVVWFGEQLPSRALSQSFEAAQRCDVCLIVGTSGLVYPAAELPQIARRHGAHLIDVNIEDNALSPICHTRLRGPAGALLAMLEAKL